MKFQSKRFYQKAIALWGVAVFLMNSFLGLMGMVIGHYPIFVPVIATGLPTVVFVAVVSAITIIES